MCVSHVLMWDMWDMWDMWVMWVVLSHVLV